MSRSTVLYASLGRALRRYRVDPGDATLQAQEEVLLPDTVQYGWQHPSRKYLYIASSNDSAAGREGTGHHLSAFRIGRDGRLTSLGEPLSLPHRPIHLCVDRGGRTVLVAYSSPSGISTHRLRDDGAVGECITAAGEHDAGVYAHQVMTAPGNRTAILVVRGFNATQTTGEVPGSLRLFEMRDGALAGKGIIAPDDGYGFGPRHLDFHPHEPWVYVSLERQNALQFFELGKDDALSPRAIHSENCLMDPSTTDPRQMAGAVHVHPNGRFVYVANRADSTVESDGKQVLAGGENSLVAFAIDPDTGKPKLAHRTAPHTLHVRTFSIDPGGTMLVAAGIAPMWVRNGGDIVRVPAALSVFRIETDGSLSFVRKYDIDAETRTQWWMAMMPLP